MVNRKDIFSSRLLTLLVKYNMANSELAKKAHVCDTSINHYTDGRSYPKVDVLIRICDALNTTPDYLLGYKKEEK